MVNKSTNINKTNNHLSPQTIKHKKIKTGSGQVQICWGLNRLIRSQYVQAKNQKSAEIYFHSKIAH